MILAYNFWFNTYLLQYYFLLSLSINELVDLFIVEFDKDMWNIVCKEVKAWFRFLMIIDNQINFRKLMPLVTIFLCNPRLLLMAYKL